MFLTAIVVSRFFGSLFPAMLKQGTVHLQAVYLSWTKDGSPTELHLERYTATNYTLVHTNQYVIGQKKYDSLCEFQHSYYKGRGILVLTKTGEVIWVDKNDGPRILKRATH